MVNDTSILAGIVILFVSLGVLLPFVNEAFGNETISIINIDAFEGNITYKAEAINDETDGSWFSYPVGVLNAFKILASVITMFVWSFQVPLFIELLFFLPLRIIAFFIVARNVWIGGGG